MNDNPDFNTFMIFQYVERIQSGHLRWQWQIARKCVSTTRQILGLFAARKRLQQASPRDVPGGLGHGDRKSCFQ